MKILYLLLFAVRPVHAVCVAVDSDQANLILRFLGRLIRLNNLQNTLTIRRGSIENNAPGHPAEGSTCVVMSSDTGSSFGILVDAIFLDELAVWPMAGEELWHSLLSSAAKRAHCALFILSNAGIRDSWQHKIFCYAQSADDWAVTALDGPQASWISQKTLDVQRRLLPVNSYLRLWENRWTDISELGLDPDDIAACITQGGPEEHRRPGHEYYLSCDLGVVRDHTSVCVVSADPIRSRLRLVCCKSWKPRRGVQVDCTEVEDFIAEAYDLYEPRAVRIDPWNMLPTIQRLAKRWGRSPDEITASFSSSTMRREMADALLSVFRGRQIELFHEPDLIDELHRVQFVDKGGTAFEILGTRDHRGHLDRCMALALALPPAIKLLRHGAFDGGASMARPASPLVAQLIQKAEPDPVTTQREGPRFRRFGIQMVDHNWDSWNRRPFQRSF